MPTSIHQYGITLNTELKPYGVALTYQGGTSAGYVKHIPMARIDDPDPSGDRRPRWQFVAWNHHEDGPKPKHNPWSPRRLSRNAAQYDALAWAHEFGVMRDIDELEIGTRQTAF